MWQQNAEDIFENVEIEEIPIDLEAKKNAGDTKIVLDKEQTGALVFLQFDEKS